MNRQGSHAQVVKSWAGDPSCLWLALALRAAMSLCYVTCLVLKLEETASLPRKSKSCGFGCPAQSGTHFLQPTPPLHPLPPASQKVDAGQRHHYEANPGRAVACLARLSSTKQRATRTSPLSFESSTYLPQPASYSIMVRQRKEPVVRPAQHYEEQERRRKSQRTAPNLWGKGTRAAVEGERLRWNRLDTDRNTPCTVC